jgi:hypothetical protein
VLGGNRLLVLDVAYDFAMACFELTLPSLQERQIDNAWPHVRNAWSCLASAAELPGEVMDTMGRSERSMGGVHAGRWQSSRAQRVAVVVVQICPQQCRSFMAKSALA